MTSVLEPTDRLQPLVVTPEEYESLPENRLLELVDGVVHAMTPPTRLHQRVVSRMEQLLNLLCPEGLVAVREQELRMRDDLRRVPDLMVIRAEADDDSRYWFSPAETVLVVEVVSPHTRTVDRLHKPAEFAASGVQHSWRIETHPAVEVHTHQLAPQGSYTFTGKFVEGDVVAAPGLPWARIAVAELIAAR